MRIAENSPVLQALTWASYVGIAGCASMLVRLYSGPITMKRWESDKGDPGAGLAMGAARDVSAQA